MSLAPEISIIIPVYNDKAVIGKSIDRLTNFLGAENFNAEIIVINDGGWDKTAEIISAKSQNNPAIKFIDRKMNLGKGASVREGISAASSNIIIFTDADLPYGTSYFKKMIELLKSGTDLVIANRNLPVRQAGLTSNTQHPTSDIGFVRHLTHWGFGFLVRHLLHLEFSDTQAGLKGLTKKAAEEFLPSLKIDRFAFDLELLVKAKRAGLQIKEVPVVLETIGKSNISVLRDSFQTLKDILKIYFSV
ncbi:hypothetical protein A2926_01890 [Candidatus Giovannonibacteria bacterium RIFCSPLOWO2_01_FULL_44_40]|uniref:Glycosyltransferase 2-like domain-containing protein n=1 Tax=Candidatus Giovannonibacteria bacterium RIFCSPHIGHO2_01_FULL_45_23 TaxID=1798325 RepID=A0A1F5VG81_9BACT|nr:MAG: hypothetical protein A2834_03260 [Candidatus Giovannonibacteria bacterium RIFCSPHIGHO2_01_FULL_45_23]OGF76908.1 MAG: hypothetical protein A3C77_04750 [Candidatus Giovannonibacteria bacterium RIFCSPHIGHO2_02_FULL_45_13]OGF80279.1 MAG: hypothetical protein A2926_01890 [Candidatus Giovannonibacteria bacterium RIFCSPLOWO2_01_FULL_44_40]